MKIEENNILPSILDRLNSMSIQVQKNFLTSMENDHREKLKSFIKVRESFFKSIIPLLNVDSQTNVLWRELENNIKEFLKLTESLQCIDSEETSAKFWEEWKKRFDEILTNVPSTEKLPLTEKYWEIKSNDSLKIRLWKKLNKRQMRFKETVRKIKIRMRKLFNKPPVDQFFPERTILVHSFLKNYFEIPVAGFLLNYWQQFLQQVATQIHQIHETTQRMIDGVLVLQNVTGQHLKPEQEQVLSNLQQIRAQRPSINMYHRMLDRFKKETCEQYNSFIAQLNKDIEYNWEYTGTFVLPAKKLREPKTNARWKDLDENFNRCKSSWIWHFKGEASDWKKDLDLLWLQVQILQICEITIDAIKTKIKEQILPNLEESHAMLSTSLKRFLRKNLKKGTDLKAEILAETRTMLRLLRKEKLPLTIDALRQAHLLKRFDDYFSRVKHTVEQLSDRHTIFRHQDLAGLPPDSKLVDIPLKALVLDDIYPDLTKGFEAFSRDLQKKIDKIARDVSEIDQIVDFNLQSAYELLENSEGVDSFRQAQNVVVQGYERARNQLASLVEQNLDIIEFGATKLKKITIEFHNQIQLLSSNEKIIALKLRVAKARTQEEFKSYRKKVINSIKSSFPSLLAFLSRNFKKIREKYKKFRRITGLIPVSSDVEEKLSQYISKTQQRISTLPYVYERLFRIQSLSDERFFEGRMNELERLQQDFDEWRNGRYGLTALVGEKGSGKTTLLNFAVVMIYKNLPIKKVEFSEFSLGAEENLFIFLQKVFQEKDVANLDELENRFIILERQRIIIVEDIQNLFLRKVDGFDTLERFLLFISRTHEKIYWIITCTLYSWRYLDKVVNLSKFFRRVIYLSGLTSNDIENIVLKRHRVSGYQLEFKVGEETIQSKKFKKLTTDESRQEYLKDLYFKQLHNLAAGNISVTMMFWLGAIIKIEQDKMIISAEMDHDFSFLDQLPLDELFTLAALLQHEMMSIDEHAKVFRQDHRASMLLLNRMTNRGVLYEKSNGSYQINLLLYRAVVRTLSRKNII
ncbi:ATP-binding protein [candidate division KSB1 bacterium]|nr:ATP-binding protein [candidate division KSB1 bacterium]